MTSARNDKKPGREKTGGRPRNPFAGRRQTGAGPHAGKKYGKKDRRKLKKDAAEEAKDKGES